MRWREPARSSPRSRELNASELRARLGNISPKSILAGVMVVGFLLTVPAWMMSDDEGRQHFAEAPAQQMVAQQIGTLDAALEEPAAGVRIKPEEKAALSKMVEPAPPSEADFEQMVWVKDIIHTITPWVPDRQEAETIASRVYANAKRFNLSPELVLGVIAVESRFDHFAVSNVGAIGLMQVMPFWKKELGHPEDNLLNIDTNIRYGCAILRHYLDRYKRLDRALAAYNGSLGHRRYPKKIFAAMKQFKAVSAGS